MKTIFLGTPALAVPFLKLLHQRTDVLSVVTNPDQPAGRGYESKASEVKAAALRLSLPVLQPSTAHDPAFLDAVQALSPDVGVVVAYGKLLPPALLKAPKLGFLNVHFSLLPAYRGAAPIQWALINGERETGVTLFWLDEGMDTGPLFVQKKIDIHPADDAESLRKKLVLTGVELLEEALGVLANEGRKERAQTGPASRAPILKKEDGRVDWNKPARQLVNQLRGMAPWPGVHGLAGAARLKILRAQVVEGSESGVPGTVVRLVSGQGFVIKCGEGYLQILLVQPEGKKAMSAWEYWQGARLKLGEKLG